MHTAQTPSACTLSTPQSFAPSPFASRRRACATWSRTSSCPGTTPTDSSASSTVDTNWSGRAENQSGAVSHLSLLSQAFPKRHESFVLDPEVAQVFNKTENPMDKWILAALQSLIALVRQEMEGYRLYTVVDPLGVYKCAPWCGT